MSQARPPSEAGKVLAVVLVLLFLGIAPPLLLAHRAGPEAPRDVEVPSYTAYLRPGPASGSIRLRESILYEINSPGYTMIYRSWTSARLLPPGAEPPGPGYIVLENVSCTGRGVPYVVTHDRRVVIMGSLEPQDRNLLLDKLREAGARDEAGCFYPGGLEEGRYRAVYQWTLYPPLDCKPGGCIADLSLAAPGEHAPYRLVQIKYAGLQVEPHPLLAWYGVSRSREDNWTVLEIEELPEEAGLRLYAELPGPGGRMDPGLLESAVSSARRGLLAGKALLTGFLAVPLLVPAAVLYAWLRWGTERPPAGPVPYGFPPRTGEKPWEVAVLYHGEPGRFDTAALNAVLASLAARGVVRISTGPTGKPVLVVGREEPGEIGEVEKRVLETLRDIANEHGVLDPDEIRRDRARRRIAGLRLRALLDELTQRYGNPLRRKAIESPPWLTKMAVALILGGILGMVALAIALPPIPTWKIAVLVAGFVMIVQSIIILLLPSHLLGRWRPGYLERYIAWTRFRRELSRGSLPPGALDQVAAYAVALGLTPEQLERLGLAAMAQLARAAGRYYRTVVPSGGAGGAGGGGGGFGGGGAGAR